MKKNSRTKLLMIPLALFFILFVSSSYAGLSGTSFTITSEIISNGGQAVSSSSFRLGCSLGQPTSMGILSGIEVKMVHGYWSTLFIPLDSRLLGDINGDGTVDLKDVVISLAILSGHTRDDAFKTGDINDDDRIGMEEVLRNLEYILEQE